MEVTAKKPRPSLRPRPRVGDRVEARWDGGARWYPGRVAEVNDDGTLAIHYDDGYSEGRVAAVDVRAKAAGRQRSVEQLDLATDRIIRIWPSIAEAARALNIQPMNISYAVRGYSADAGGFGWRPAPPQLNFDERATADYEAAGDDEAHHRAHPRLGLEHAQGDPQ